MAAYTDAARIAAHLGVTFTTAQATQADVVAGAVTAWIDTRTQRTWQAVSGSVVDEIQPISNGVVYVEYVPVLAVSQLETRIRGGTNPWALLDPGQYALVDPATGRIEITGVALFAGWPVGASVAYDARVDYTTSVTAPPADVAYAATVLSADVMFTSLHPESAGVDSIAVGQNDLSIRYAAPATVESGHVAGVPLAVRIVDAHRRVVLA